MHRRSPTPASTDAPEEVVNRWPHIQRFLRVDDSTGRVEDDFRCWLWRAEDRVTAAQRAAAYEEWADFWEWSLGQRTAELAGDRVKRHLVETWTDSMAYTCRRSAAWVRGDDPGEWISPAKRRPDLHAEGHAIVAEIVAALDGCRWPAESAMVRVVDTSAVT